jgi:hypothetical protein
VCYERSWEARQRNDEATRQIRRLFARYRAEAQRAQPVSTDRPAKPAQPMATAARDDERKLALR